MVSQLINEKYWLIIFVVICWYYRCCWPNL